MPPGERQTGISVRRQLPLSKFFCLRQTFFLPKPISLPSSTLRLTCLKMGTVFHCPFANYLTFFSPTTWNLFSTVSFPIYLGFFLTHNCKFIFLVNFFFSQKTIWIIDVSFFIWSYGSQLSSVTKKSSFRFLVLSNDFFFLNRHISDISGTCFRFFLFSWWTWKSSNIFFLTSKRFFFTN